MQNDDRIPQNFHELLDDIVKNAEKYGAAAAQGNLPAANLAMSRVKEGKRRLEQAVAQKVDSHYRAGLELGASQQNPGARA